MKSYFGGKFQTVATGFDFFAKISAFPVFDYAVILRQKLNKYQKLNPNKTQTKPKFFPTKPKQNLNKPKLSSHSNNLKIYKEKIQTCWTFT